MGSQLVVEPVEPGPAVVVGLPLKLIVKENLAARLRQRIANSDWCKKLRDLGNWAHVRETSPGLAGQVEAIVVLAEELVSECSKAIPSNRWRDPDAAFRVLRRLEAMLIVLEET